MSEQKYTVKADTSIMSSSAWRAKVLWSRYCTSTMGANWMGWDGFERAIAELLSEIRAGLDDVAKELDGDGREHGGSKDTSDQES